MVARPRDIGSSSSSPPSLAPLPLEQQPTDGRGASFSFQSSFDAQEEGDRLLSVRPRDINQVEGEQEQVQAQTGTQDGHVGPKGLSLPQWREEWEEERAEAADKVRRREEDAKIHRFGGGRRYWNSYYGNPMKFAEVYTRDWYSSGQAIAKHIMQEEKGAGLLVLELGCGLSDLGSALEGMGCRVISLDFSPIAVLQAARTRRSGFLRLPVRRESFDLVVEKATLDTILCGGQSESNFTSACLHALNALKPGGRFISISHTRRAHRLASSSSRWQVTETELLEHEVDGTAQGERVKSGAAKALASLYAVLPDSDKERFKVASRAALSRSSPLAQLDEFAASARELCLEHGGDEMAEDLTSALLELRRGREEEQAFVPARESCFVASCRKREANEEDGELGRAMLHMERMMDEMFTRQDTQGEGILRALASML